MHAVGRQETSDTIFPLICADPLRSASKSHDDGGASVVNYLLSGGDHARDNECGSVRRKKAQTSSLDIFYDSKSSDGDHLWSSAFSSARRRHDGKDFRASKMRATDRDSDQMAVRSDARGTPADSCDIAAQTDVGRSTV